MKEVEILAKQTEDAYGWMNRLVNSVPVKKWDVLADGVESNISWQIGHQVISIYYHTIMTTVGHIPEIIARVNMRRYSQMCMFNTYAKDMVGKTDPEQLMEHLEFIQTKSVQVLRSLSSGDLQKPVEPTKMPHPVAKLKFEAIDWNVKHTMWHCGQISILKRMVDRPYDFGLQKPD